MKPGPPDGRRRRWCQRAAVRSAASAAVLLVVGAGWASPAGAHPDADDHGSISLSATGDLGGPPSVSGTFFGGSALGVFIEYIRSVSLTVTPTGPTGGGPASADGCKLVTAGKCGTGTVSFTWDLPGLAYNGPYVVNATADHCQAICVSSGPATFTSRAFRLAADPSPPADVKAETGADRNVVLSWQRNPEPDILFYQVSRKEGGGGFSRVGGDIRQPGSGRPTFTDTSTSSTAGGEFAYRVVAVRKGASGDDSTTRTSRASGDRSVTVAAPPTTLPPGAPGSEITPAGTDTNIGGYLAGRAGALPSPRPLFVDLPDTGFEGSLPFGQLPGEDMSEPGEGEEATPATLETRRLQEFNRGRPLIPIAAGAILLLMAAHLRLFNKRLKHDGTPRRSSAAEFIASLDASKHARMELDVDAAVANGGHHRTPSGADLTDLPEWGQFRGVTLLPASTDADEDEIAGDEAWAGDSLEAVVTDAEAEDSELDEDGAERDGWVVAGNGQAPAAVAGIGEEDEDAFVAETKPWDDEGVAEELGARGVDDVDAWDDEAEREAWGEVAMVDLEADDEAEQLGELEPDEEAELLGELEPDEEAELLGELEPDEEDELLGELEPNDDHEMVADLDQDQEAEPLAGPELEFDEEAELLAELELESDDEAKVLAELELESDDEAEVLAELEPDEDYEMVAELEAEEPEEVVAELVGASGPVVIPDQDEPEEVVAQLVSASGPMVVIPLVGDLEEPEPEPAAAPVGVPDTAEIPEAAAAASTSTNGNGDGSGHPPSDFDDFEWSEEAQYAEPEVEVFVAPKPAAKKLASWAR